jgi:glycosyltransferase involved in cell wall biosynthesis
VIPVFNGERYLEQALDSIAMQTCPPAEIIVVDDGSTDGTAAIAQSGRYDVRYIEQENAGPSVARNTGIGAAAGEFIAFLDADDRWHPRKLERQMAVLRDGPEVAATVAHAEMFAEESSSHPGGRPVAVAIPAYISGTLVARRSAFTDVGLFNAALKHADDTEWFLRARAMGHEVVLLPDVLLYRRMHQANMSLTGRSDSLDEYLALIKADIARRRALKAARDPQT